MTVATALKPSALNAVSFVYRKDDPMPIEADPEAIGVLAEARGTVAESELSGAILTLDAELLATRARMADAETIRARMPQARDILARRAVYVARLGMLRRKLGIKAAPPSKPPEMTDLVNLLASSSEGQDVRVILARDAAKARDELASNQQEIDGLSEVLADDARYAAAGENRGSYKKPRMDALHAIQADVYRLLDDVGRGPYRDAGYTHQMHELPGDVRALISYVSSLGDRDSAGPQWPQDLLVERLDAKVRARKALTARLAALDGDTSQSTAVVADRVTRAVEAGGGAAALVADLTAASVMLGKTDPSLEGLKARFTDSVASVQGINSELDALTAVVGSAGSAVAALKARLQTARTEADAARAEFLAAQTECSTRLLDLALSGEELSRSAIESLALDRPEAFPAGFPSAIAGARFDRAVADEAQRSLSLTATESQAQEAA